jgi:hypothetical protein
MNCCGRFDHFFQQKRYGLIGSSSERTISKVHLPSDLLCRNLPKIYAWGGDVLVSWRNADVGAFLTAD